MQINQEREGLQIDCDLLKNVIHTFVELEKYGQTKYYEDFEQAMLADTSALYTRLASEWLLCDSAPDYIQKVILCINLSTLDDICLRNQTRYMTVVYF